MVNQRRDGGSGVRVGGGEGNDNKEDSKGVLRFHMWITDPESLLYSYSLPPLLLLLLLPEGRGGGETRKTIIIATEREWVSTNTTRIPGR